MLRVLAVAAVCLGLQACAIVGSQKPLFTAADARGAPVLRPGLWAMPETGCQGFDPKAPADTWPECANMVIVRADTIGGNEKQDDGSFKKRELAYILAAGDPRVLQLAGPADRKPDDPAFLYVGVRPGRLDGWGRIVEGQIWLVLCEAPPDPDHLLRRRKPRPLPGLKPNPNDSGCMAEAPGPVRAAAAATEGWLKTRKIEDAIITVRWVRDGER